MAPQYTSKMWGVFDEAGIFVALCRHGFLLTAADIVRSGEQYVIFSLTQSITNITIEPNMD